MLKEIKEKLRKIQPELHAKYGVSRIGVFGSFSRGEEVRDSDIDILVEFDKDIDIFEYIDLRDFLSENLSRKVDLVTKDAIKPLIKDDIMKEVVYL
ncbi:nucleotidyltransferase family protein [candidate division WOR-3 bacterium]|nr:nucleotidyltransferase family protein [candidate division WOR-3 bacterium]